MMETIKPYHDKLIQAKKQLDEAWKGETGPQPVVTGSQANDVLELKENLSRVSLRGSVTDVWHLFEQLKYSETSIQGTPLLDVTSWK